MVKILPILALGFSVVFAAQANAECSRDEVLGANAALPEKGAFNERLLDRAILAEVNYRRCKIGRSALRPLTQLRTPARDHSAWMAKKQRLSHKSSVVGRMTVGDRVRSVGIKPRAYAENLAQLPIYNLTPTFQVADLQRCQFIAPNGKRVQRHSYRSLAYKVVNLWMKSPGHRRNLLNTKTSHLASAAVLKPGSNYCGDVYVTQIFVG